MMLVMLMLVYVYAIIGIELLGGALSRDTNIFLPNCAPW